jgi:hypothetical protein
MGVPHDPVVKPAGEALELVLKLPLAILLLRIPFRQKIQT